VTKSVGTGLVVLGLTVVSFLVGLAVGHHGTFDWVMGYLQNEVEGNLTQRVETLARLRTGDEAGAISFLEDSIDRATVNLATNRPWTEMSPQTQNALAWAKLYREAFPAAADAEVTRVLEKIPMPDVRDLSPAVRQLLEEGSENGPGRSGGGI